VLLLDDGWTFREIRAVTYSSFQLIARAARLYRSGGVDAVLAGTGTEVQVPPEWLGRVAGWLSSATPEDFGYFRRRWSCETLAEVLAWETGGRKSAETIRRGLHQLGRVSYSWGQPFVPSGARDACRTIRQVSVRSWSRPREAAMSHHCAVLSSEARRWTVGTPPGSPPFI
jgi:hypothetical protein